MYVRYYEFGPRAVELVLIKLATAQFGRHISLFLLYVLNHFVKRHHLYVFLASRVLHLNEFVEVIYIYTK
jgi:hypothetical protein